MEAAAALIGLGGADLSVRDNSGATPLHVAVDKNHLMLAKTLMDRGAAVDTTTHVSGCCDSDDSLDTLTQHGCASVGASVYPSKLTAVHCRLACSAGLLRLHSSTM